MSPSSPNDRPTVKQQRAAAREAKLVEYRRAQARSRRNRKIAIGASITGAVAIVGLIATTVVLTPKPVTYSTNGTHQIDGLQTFANGAAHTTEPVTYPQTPPAGGEHHPMWLNCGVYEEPQPNENAVHSMEHGAVWVTYDPALPADELEAIRAKIPSTYTLLSPFPGLDSPIALSAWNAQLKIDSASDERFAQFFENHWRSDRVPEPGASCTGALDGPGKV